MGWGHASTLLTPPSFCSTCPRGETEAQRGHIPPPQPGKAEPCGGSERTAGGRWAMIYPLHWASAWAASRHGRGCQHVPAPPLAPRLPTATDTSLARPPPGIAGAPVPGREVPEPPLRSPLRSPLLLRGHGHSLGNANLPQHLPARPGDGRARFLCGERRARLPPAGRAGTAPAALAATSAARPAFGPCPVAPGGRGEGPVTLRSCPSRVLFALR